MVSQELKDKLANLVFSVPGPFESLDVRLASFEALLLSAYEAGRDAERERAITLCDRWARYWNLTYERDAKRTRGRVMWHQIGTAVWAIGMKIGNRDDCQEPPQ